MSTIIRGSGDTTFGGTLQSTGIDDNATSTAITIDASENVNLTQKLTASRFGISSGTNNYIEFANDGKASHFTGAAASYIWSGQGSTGDYLAGTLNFQSRSSVPRDMNFITGSTPAKRLTITGDGRGLSQFTAKAWVNFNGTGTVAIRDSHNVSSITDWTTGVHSVNYSNNMADTNYCVITGQNTYVQGSGDTRFQVVIDSQTVSGVTIKRSQIQNGFYLIDGDTNHIAVFGD